TMTESKMATPSRLVIVLMLSLAIAYGVFAGSGLAAPTTAAVQAPVSGTARLSGTVDSTVPFKAAQVFIRNVDKRILYMVYTSAGQFRAVSLMPGNYEVSVSTKGLESDVQKLALKSGDNPKLKLSLRAANTANADSPEEASYDAIYPPGPGRDVAERTC